VFWGDTKTTSNAQNPMEFLIPRSVNRFHFTGGARFFHGGAMLQEVMVPVVMISEMKGKHLEASEVHQVGISLLGSPKKNCDQQVPVLILFRPMRCRKE
jgi:hypothetical protein